MNWIRNNMAVFVWFTAGAFVIWMFAIMGMGAFDGGQQARDLTLATVNGVSISYGDFQERVSEQRRELARERQGQISGEELQQLRQDVFDRMVRETLLQQQARQEGYRADDNQVEMMLTMQLMGQQDFNPDQLDQILAQFPDHRREAIFQDVRRQLESMTQQQWLGEHMPRRSLLEYQLADGLREARTWGIYLDPMEFVEEEEIQEYYEAFEERFRKEPEARVREIYLGNPRETDDPEQAFSELEETMETIDRRLQTGADFVELAEEFNVDPDLAERGGDLGWIEPDDLPNREARRIFEREPGQHTSLIRTDDGFHYYYLEEGPVQETKPLDEVRDEIKQELLDDRHRERALETIHNFQEQILDSDNPLATLQDLASQHSHSPTAQENGSYGWLPSHYLTIERHSHAGPWSEEIARDQFIHTAVRESVFPESNNTGLRDLVETDRGFHLFYVEEKRSPGLEDLPDDTVEQWVNRLRQQHAQEYREAWLDWMQARADVQIELTQEQRRQIGIQLTVDDGERGS